MIDLLDGGYLRHALEQDVRTGLTAVPKWLPPKWFYDEVGSELFVRITRLAEYYPSRRELEILRRHAAGIARYGLGRFLAEWDRLLEEVVRAAR